MQKPKGSIIMNLQITIDIYSTKITILIVSQGDRASSKDMPHDVFLLSLFSKQFHGGYAKYSLISCVLCAKGFSFILIHVWLDFLLGNELLLFVVILLQLIMPYNSR